MQVRWRAACGRPLRAGPASASASLNPVADSSEHCKECCVKLRSTAELLKNVTALAVAAAKAILDCRTDSSVSIKADGSPVTPADETAEMLIRAGLARLAPSVPGAL